MRLTVVLPFCAAGALSPRAAQRPPGLEQLSVRVDVVHAQDVDAVLERPEAGGQGGRQALARAPALVD